MTATNLRWRWLRGAVAFGLLAAFGASAMAQPHGEPPGLARKERGHGDRERERDDRVRTDARVDIRIGAVFTDQHRADVQAYYGHQVQQTRRCPPGLAKKNNGCLPPGQAKKLVVGQPLPPDAVWYSVPPPVIARLPVVPVGYRYVRIGADIVLLGGRPNVVIDVMASLPL